MRKTSDKVPRLLFTAAALLLAVTLVFTYYVGLYVVRATKAMAFQRAVIQHLQEISSIMQDAETGQRGYLLTGRPEYLAPYEDAVRRLHGEQESVHALVKSGHLNPLDVTALDQHIRQKMGELELTIQMRRTNAPAAMTTVQTDRGKAEMDQIRTLLKTLINREELQYQRTVETSSAATFARSSAFIFTGMINLAFLAWVYRRLNSEIISRRFTTEKLQSTIDSISDGLMTLDHQWHMTYLSKQGARILRVNQTDMLGKILWEALPQAREKQTCPYFYDAMEQKQPRHAEEYYPGLDQWLGIHCYPSPEGLTVYFHDITERKRAEQVLARSREELEKLVAERTAKLQELVGELEHFSYTITHDMRSPLRAMTGFAQILEDLGPTCSAEQRQHYLSRISAAARRMDLLITDALNYNRAVREELPIGSVDVGALIRGMLDSYPEFQPSRATINIDGDIPNVIGNEAGLTQTFSNLLGNAVKFVKPGEQPHVTIRAEESKGWVRIWIEDEGIGIESVALPKVFDMFTRAQTTHEGTGIGLALVRKVVTRMGGKLGVESEFGKGSRFWIELKSAGSAAATQRTLAMHA
jgi:signal transduction histidine kinase